MVVRTDAKHLASRPRQHNVHVKHFPPLISHLHVKGSERHCRGLILSRPRLYKTTQPLGAAGAKGDKDPPLPAHLYSRHGTIGVQSTIKKERKKEIIEGGHAHCTL